MWRKKQQRNHIPFFGRTVFVCSTLGWFFSKKSRSNWGKFDLASAHDTNLYSLLVDFNKYQIPRRLPDDELVTSGCCKSYCKNSTKNHLKNLQMISSGFAISFSHSVIASLATRWLDKIQDKHFWQKAISRHGHLDFASAKETKRISPHLKRNSFPSILIMSLAHFFSDSSSVSWQFVKLTARSHVFLWWE